MTNKINVLKPFHWKLREYPAGGFIRLSSGLFSESDIKVLTQMGHLEELPVAKKATKKKGDTDNDKDGI